MDFSNKITIDTHNPAVFLSFLQCLGEHQLTHPIDPLIPRLNSKMMRLAARVQEQCFAINLLARVSPILPISWDQGEAKGGLVSCVFSTLQDGLFERGCELGVGGEGGAGDGVVVDVDVLESFGGATGCLVVRVHGELGAAEGEVVVLPLVAEEAGGFALLHPAAVGHVGWRAGAGAAVAFFDDGVLRLA